MTRSSLATLRVPCALVALGCAERSTVAPPPPAPTVRTVVVTAPATEVRVGGVP